MADTAGLVLGSASLFGQTLSACLHGFERYNKVNDLGAEFVNLQTQIVWARSRLAAWALDWGIEEGRHLNNVRFQQYVEMATSHLVHINYLLATLDKDEEALPTLAAAGKQARTPTAALSRWSKTGDVSSQDIKDLTDRIEQLNANSNTAEKIRYYLSDGRAAKTVDTVKAMVEDLWLHFPPDRDDIAAALVRNRLLQSNSPEVLDAAAHSAQTNPALAALTLLKIEHLRLQQRADELASTDPDDPAGVIVENSEVWTGERGAAYYYNPKKLPRRVHVMIEKKEVPNEPRYQRHKERIRGIARLLSLGGKPREMRTLGCLGVVSVMEEHSTTYKLLYRLPRPSFFTLKEIMSTQRKTPTLPLGKKFICAKVLCRAILWIHLAGWLHKSIRSDNVIFCADKEPDANLAEPFLCGFEYSRLTASPLDTDAPVATDNLYRHPDVQGLPEDKRGTERPEFESAHDVYALGMTLLELGSHRSLPGLKEKYEKNSKQRWSAAPFREWLLQGELDSLLVPRMGEIYTDVVRCCLAGLKTDDGSNFQETFWSRVVKKVDMCIA